MREDRFAALAHRNNTVSDLDQLRQVQRRDAGALVLQGDGVAPPQRHVEEGSQSGGWHTPDTPGSSVDIKARLPQQLVVANTLAHQASQQSRRPSVAVAPSELQNDDGQLQLVPVPDPGLGLPQGEESPCNTPQSERSGYDYGSEGVGEVDIEDRNVENNENVAERQDSGDNSENWGGSQLGEEMGMSNEEEDNELGEVLLKYGSGRDSKMGAMPISDVLDRPDPVDMETLLDQARTLYTSGVDGIEPDITISVYHSSSLELTNYLIALRSVSKETLAQVIDNSFVALQREQEQGMGQEPMQDDSDLLVDGVASVKSCVMNDFIPWLFLSAAHKATSDNKDLVI